MNLRQINYLLAVVEEGSFTRAAQRLSVAQPSLSQQIRALERELGGPLLERMPNGVQLTAAGRAFLPEAKSAAAHATRAAEAVRQTLGVPGGQLEIATVTSLAVGLLPDVLARWHRLHADTTVHLQEFQHRRDLYEAVRGGLGDVALGPRPANWPGPITPLGWEEFVVVLPSYDPLARGDGSRIALKQLADRDWVLLDPGHGLHDVVQRACAGAGFVPRAAVRTGQVAAAAQLAAAGLGPTLLGSHAIPSGLDAALLHVRPRLVREVVAFTRSVWSPAAEEFLKLFGELPMRSRPRGSELIS
ncbi:MAG TPA: LysR family transcriptional regulator [Solirubrobacteraceae bacterium]|nr:LysR family transcriptional regulator [Solirubrobacteraceae bacterium]